MTTHFDVELNDQGSIWLVTPMTPEAQDWISENVQVDAQFWGASLAVEHRFIGNLVDAIINDGLRVRVN